MPESYEVRFTEAARDDLRRIGWYLSANASPEIARRVVTELREAASDLRTFPERGSIPRELEEIGAEQFRQIVRKPYRIFYAVAGDMVAILLIADGRRDMQGLLSQRLLGR